MKFKGRFSLIFKDASTKLVVNREVHPSLDLHNWQVLPSTQKEGYFLLMPSPSAAPPTSSCSTPEGSPIRRSEILDTVRTVKNRELS